MGMASPAMPAFKPMSMPQLSTPRGAGLSASTSGWSQKPMFTFGAQPMLFGAGGQ
jgi:hypothetical protein